MTLLMLRTCFISLRLFSFVSRWPRCASLTTDFVRSCVASFIPPGIWLNQRRSVLTRGFCDVDDWGSSQICSVVLILEPCVFMQALEHAGCAGFVRRAHVISRLSISTVKVPSDYLNQIALKSYRWGFLDALIFFSVSQHHPMRFFNHSLIL